MAELDVGLLGAMTEKQRNNRRIRERVVDMYKEFVSEVDPKNVLDLLIQKRVISIHQKQEITNKVTVIDRCRALLDHLFCCSNDESFIVLREALEDQYPWIVERIDHCETENETSKIKDTKCSQSNMTKTEHQEHSEDPIHVNLQFDFEEQLKKALESMKSNFEIGTKKSEQKLEESRKDIAKIKEQYEKSRKETAKMKKRYEESRKENAEMKEQNRILKEDFDKALRESNSESTKESNSCTVVIVNYEFAMIMSLSRPEDVIAIEPLPDKWPPKFHIGATAAVYRNSIFVCRLGNKGEDIWRLDASSSKWSICASLVQGRQRHSVAFVDHVLYIIVVTFKRFELYYYLNFLNFIDKPLKFIKFKWNYHCKSRVM